MNYIQIKQIVDKLFTSDCVETFIKVFEVDMFLSVTEQMQDWLIQNRHSRVNGSSRTYLTTPIEFQLHTACPTVFNSTLSTYLDVYMFRLIEYKKLAESPHLAELSL